MFPLTVNRSRILILACLILVRFVYPIIVSTLASSHPDSAWTYKETGQYAYVVLTYILSCLFFRTISKEDRHLFNLTKPNKRLYLFVGAVALLCMVIEIASQWLFMGGEWTSQITSIGNPMIFAIGFPIYSAWLLIIKYVLNALPEELLFRGFLWGSMRQCKFSDFSILCTQAILFWAAHFQYYDMPVLWIRVLLWGLVFGIVAWKTKSLFLAAIVHACVNATAGYFN